jgi:hypothetical protein
MPSNPRMENKPIFLKTFDISLETTEPRNAFTSGRWEPKVIQPDRRTDATWVIGLTGLL